MFLGFTHFVTTWIGCIILLQMGVFTYKPLPFQHVLPLALVREEVILVVVVVMVG